VAVGGGKGPSGRRWVSLGRGTVTHASLHSAICAITKEHRQMPLTQITSFICHRQEKLLYLQTGQCVKGQAYAIQKIPDIPTDEKYSIMYILIDEKYSIM
jgi:hypothetical protein